MQKFRRELAQGLRLVLNTWHELKARQAFVDKQLNDAFKAFYLGFLTEEEMVQVIDGTDFWMGVEEIQERWNNYLKYKK